MSPVICPFCCEFRSENRLTADKEANCFYSSYMYQT